MRRKRLSVGLRWSISVLLLLSFAAGAVAKKKTPSPESLYNQALVVLKTDPKAAQCLFMKAAKRGHIPSMIRVGYCYQLGTGVRQDSWHALNWYKKSVESGDPSAEYTIGFMYEKGDRRVHQDYVQAIEWYEKALQHHSLKACAGLARIYASSSDPQFHDGEKAIKYATVLVKRDLKDADGLALLAAAYARNIEFDKAVKAITRSAAVSALADMELRHQRKEEYKLGCPFPAECTDAWLLQAADQNSIWAMLRLAARYNDEIGEMFDRSKARYWYEKALEKGSNEALVPLGKLYAVGRGGAVDEKKAFQYFSTAAKAEIMAAYAPLARMYVGGKGVRSDFELAQIWYDKASKSGDRSASYEASCLRTLRGIPSDVPAKELYVQGKSFADSGNQLGRGTASFSERTSRVFAFYWIAAEKGNTDAMQALAEMYFYGPCYFVRDTKPEQKNGGIKTNYERALFWYEQLEKEGITPPEYEQCKTLYAQELAELRERRNGHH